MKNYVDGIRLIKGGEMDNNELNTDVVLGSKVSAVFCYLGGFITGIIFFGISKNSYVRYHAMQSTLYAIFVIIFWFLLFNLSVQLNFFYITWIINLGLIVVWIVLMVKAYSGEKYKLPYLGKLAEKYVK